MNRYTPLAFLAAVLVAAIPALAQMVDEQPYPVRVTVDNAEVRCGWGSDAWYSVGRAPRGTTLTADGREGDWLRVRYPEGLNFGVLLRVSDVELDEAAGTAILTAAARPIHRNRQSPASGSWMKMTGEPFPAGTAFEVVQTVQNQGETVMVLVEAPDRTRGYVRSSDVEATEAGATTQPEPTPDAQPETAEASSDQLPDPFENMPADENNSSEGVNVVTPMAEPDAEQASETEAEAGPTPSQLFDAYDAIIREPLESAEIEPLIGEYRWALTNLDADAPNAARLQARLDLLELRRDVQRDLQAVTDAAERAAGERETVDRLISEWRARPTYTVVGRLMASTLYDGNRLPLMYRLQSLDGPGGRTIAYILPTEELDLASKLGGVVGVLGEARRDRTIRVRMIEPERVDVLEAGGS